MDRYPSGNVRELLQTDGVTAATRNALVKRLQSHESGPPKFFSATQMSILNAAAARLIPQTAGGEPIDITTEIDRRLAEGTGNGWRFATLPADNETWRSGLLGLDQSAMEMHGTGFVALTSRQQENILRLVQSGDAPGDIWRSLDGPRFFEELLADLAEAYYSHPLAQEEIGYVGMADAPGWKHIGLDELEDREPRSEERS